MSRYFFLLILFCICGCQDRTIGPVAQQAVSRNTQDMALLADFLKGKMPWAGIILAEKAQTIAEAVPLADGVAKPRPALTPQVLSLADASDAAAAVLANQVQAQETASRGEVKAEQQASWFDGLFSWTGAGTIMGMVLLALRGAAALGVPYVGAIEGVLSGLFSLRKKKLDAATTLVEGAEVARHGLVAVEQSLPTSTRDDLSQAIIKATGGRANNIEALFRLLAKAYAIDQGKAAEADSLLTEIRSNMDTTAGRPPMVAQVVKGS